MFRQHLHNNQHNHRVIDALKYILMCQDNEIKMGENNQFHFQFYQQLNIYRKNVPYDEGEKDQSGEDSHMFGYRSENCLAETDIVEYHSIKSQQVGAPDIAIEDHTYTKHLCLSNIQIVHGFE
jgi:hypothetical protein